MSLKTIMGDEGKVWEYMIKLSIPLVVAASAAVITHEVKFGRIDERFKNYEREMIRLQVDIKELPFEEIRVEMRSIKSILITQDKRLSEIEFQLKHRP